MKQKTTTTKSEPPAVAGGFTSAGEQAAAGMTDTDQQPPATAGGSDRGASLDALRAENEQLKATIRLRSAHRQITGELATAGARSPELLFDAIRGELQFGEDGEVLNSAAIVEQLKARFPEQFGRGASLASIDAGAGLVSAPRLTREALAKMKPSQIAELDWNEVRRVLAAS